MKLTRNTGIYIFKLINYIIIKQQGDFSNLLIGFVIFQINYLIYLIFCQTFFNAKGDWIEIFVFGNKIYIN